MMGKPAISVCNWLIPDVKPSRYPADDYEYVVKTRKEQLTECVRIVLSHYEEYASQAQKYSNEHFANLGHCIPMMIDILDANIENRKCKYQALVPQKREIVPFSKWKFHVIEMTKREVYCNYGERRKVVRSMWHVARETKRIITGK